jgi:hypothetical protein
MSDKNDNIIEKYLYYEKMISENPEDIYVSTKAKLKNDPYKSKYLLYSLDNLYDKYNNKNKQEILCIDDCSHSHSDDDNYKKNKKKAAKKSNNIKLLALSSLFVVNTVFAGNYFYK